MKLIKNRNKRYSKNKRQIIEIEIKDSVQIIENKNKVHYFVSGIQIFNFYFNFIEFFLSFYPVLIRLNKVR